MAFLRLHYQFKMFRAKWIKNVSLLLFLSLVLLFFWKILLCDGDAFFLAKTLRLEVVLVALAPSIDELNEIIERKKFQNITPFKLLLKQAHFVNMDKIIDS